MPDRIPCNFSSSLVCGAAYSKKKKVLEKLKVFGRLFANRSGNFSFSPEGATLFVGGNEEKWDVGQLPKSMPLMNILADGLNAAECQWPMSPLPILLPSGSSVDEYCARLPSGTCSSFLINIHDVCPRWRPVES